jgi:CBS domain containing-hemolysin-like protein
MLGGRFTHSAYPVRGFDGRIVGMLVLADLTMLDPLTWTHQRVLELARPIEQVDVVLAGRSLDQVMVELRHGGETLVVDETGRTVGTLGPAEIQRANQVAAFNQSPSPAPDRGVPHVG